MEHSLFHHFALPQNIPHSEDANLDDVETHLANHLLAATRTIEGCVGDQPNLWLDWKSTTVWGSIRQSLATSRSVNRGGRVNQMRLLWALASMTPSDIVLLHIRSQNAAVLIHRLSSSTSEVVFEVFEASPRNEDVLAAENALQWDFPGTAVAIPLATFNDEEFQASLASFLEQASIESTKAFAGHTFKAGVDVHENRDTASPTIISSLLMAVLGENGRRISTPLLRKRVRDDICWSSGRPWRRSPYWLSLRVAVARYLLLALGPDLGRFAYKFLLCVCLARFMDSTQPSLQVDELHFLKAKLSRRLAKLDVERDRVQDQDLLAKVELLFEHLTPGINAAIHGAVQRVESEWEQWKQSSIKPIPPLPKRAWSRDTQLELRNSGERLREIRAKWQRTMGGRQRRWVAPAKFDFSSAGNAELAGFAKPLFEITELEDLVHEDYLRLEAPDPSPRIHRLIARGLPLYQGNAAQMSLLILNVMELWVTRDEQMCRMYPLLRQYDPVFTPEILDVLHLARYEDMVRLQTIQTYLQKRITACQGSKTVFDDPTEDCFARRYYDEGPADEVERMRALRRDIEESARKKKQSKMEEWIQKSTTYETLTRQIDASSCIPTVDENHPLGTEEHVESRCPRCQAIRRLNQLRIQIYEHLLPHQDFMAKAVVFELMCPPAFAAYRDTTWMVLSRLACPAPPLASTLPRCTLHEYSQLEQFADSTQPSFTLASFTKSFLRTHYAYVPFPVEWESGRDGVCKPNGLKLAYFDSRSRIWTGRAHLRPSFAHHVQLQLPPNSPFRPLLSDGSFTVRDDGPSSYEIMATQMNCPSGLNPHESLAFKTLLSGTARRWISILVELGSTNLNWSSETTMALLNHLALQCGPPCGGDDPLKLHRIFRDTQFVEKLLAQVNSRLSTLAALSSWREAHLMGSMITLALRTLDLAHAACLPKAICQAALASVLQAREICLRWFTLLREEIQKSPDATTAQQLQQRALAAALLCRRTFAIHLEQSVPFDVDSLVAYLESAIVIQENMVSKIDSLPRTLHQDLVAAVKLAYRLQDLVSTSICERSEGLSRALRQFWPDSERIESGNSTVTLEQPGWLCCDIAETETESRQVVHFNFLLGTLLVNGKPVGKLPQDTHNSMVIRELFGDQPLWVFQSPVQGMSYTLTYRPNGLIIHVGYEGRETVILARAPATHGNFRFIPRTYFQREKTCDLPGPLMQRIHWLNLDTGDVYIVPHASRWTMRNPWQVWTLNLDKRSCWKMRDTQYREDIIEPFTPLFRRVSRILEGLAPPDWLLVTQPAKPGSGLEVHIVPMQLMFFVRNNQLLYSPQLNLEIDPNQDAGTWYGLLSKLVCRKVDNPFRRTVLVPLGALSTKRWGCHVVVKIGSNSDYGKFPINDTLGRIDCAAEPALVYAKALLHAYTSFLLPDPLTGRTGIEESLHWLRSGICHPWEVLRPDSLAASMLSQIASLTPVREYYPPGRKVMKTDRWGRSLTTHMQHPLFRQAVEEILAISEELSTFAAIRGTNESTTLSDRLPPSGEAHLTRRALVRRGLYERRLADANDEPMREVSDKVYLSRDRPSASDARCARVMETTHLLRTKPDTFRTPHNLATILAQGNNIGGYGTEYRTVALNDRMRVDIRENWGSLVEYCRHGRSSYSVMFLLATLSFRENFDEALLMALLKALVAFAVFDELQSLTFPRWDSYFNFRPDGEPRLDDVVKLISPFRTPAPKDDGEELGQLMNAKQRRKIKEAKEAFEMKSEEHCRYLAKFFLAQWPCREPDISTLPHNDLLVDTRAALEVVRPEWLRLFQNKELATHLKHVQQILDQHRSNFEFNIPQVVTCEEVFPPPNYCRAAAVPRLESDLLAKPLDPSDLFVVRAGHRLSGWCPLASIPKDGRQSSTRTGNRQAVASNAQPRVSLHETARYMEELQQIIDSLGKSKSLVRKNYARDLSQSLEAFRNLRTPQQLANPFLYLRDNSASGSEVLRTFLSVKYSLERQTEGMSARRIEWLKLGGLWPAVTTVTLLEQLRSTASPRFGTGMRAALISFGLAITRLQRDERLNDCVLAGDTSRFQDEESNIGHTNWNVEDHADWLLLELESNLLIRPTQVDVARATISPASGANSVLQMNMGQGKTSCIIPMVAASMADRKSLVRVIVPKALLLQTAQLLQSRLGGILNRCVTHIPFSRRTATHGDSIRRYYELHKRTCKTAGVMLCLPEHNLSFMLSGQQRILDDKIDEATPMVKIQAWLRSVCRDILDESDYTLAARTQLIYPSGSQMAVDGHPHRWLVIEAVLSLVEEQLYGLRNSYPHSIEVVTRQSGGFPFIYFLRQDVEDELLRRLATAISKGAGNILPVSSFDARQRGAIKDFLSPCTRRLKPSTLERIRGLQPDRPQVKQTVYLLRGLLVHRILIMTLKKRWNVQYGLRPNSDPVAVPYHAKGVPSEQSEWGHPDVSILFTCLTFYYDGLQEEQLRQALARVLKSDDPSTEYDKWVQNSESLPASLRAWNTINVEDEGQVHDIWQAVRYRVVVIDYFLNNFVFPRHAKQFKVKLQSSGWDIPLFSAQPTKREPRSLTTGFSGTNDNRTMLPLTIQQSDLPTLSHTNAEVLTYLLHDRSRKCAIITDVRGGRATERDLLHMLKERKIGILIDAGAQILEMDNQSLVKAWLAIDKSRDAALYFDSDNKPWVITKTNRKTPLLASPYADDLTKCLVYLDEAHTRGTDLKLPLNARGALTVGQGQSKDHTVQAAMRLRQLGTSQSITFFIPPEVQQVIADLQRKPISEPIDSHDVICWLLDNTCEGIEQLQPLLYAQGIDFCRRTQAAIEFPDFLTDPDHRAKYVAYIRQTELQTLQEMYEPKAKGGKHAELKLPHPSVAAFLEELNVRRKGFQDTGRAVHGSALQEVEQEREVAFEVEAIRQVKKPVRYDPLSYPGLHRDIEIFARNGRLPPDSHSISHVFRFIATTALGRKHKVSWRGRHAHSKLFVSAEFGRTVKLYTHLAPDNFLRPVSWILWSELTETAIILIPEEAEHIIQMMHAEKTHPKISLITYASPVTRKMLAFDNLTFFSMPALPQGWVAPQWLKTELGLLAGRLYFEWHEYDALCKFLGITEGSSSGSDEETDDVSVDDDEYSDDEIEDVDDDLPVKNEENGHTITTTTKSSSSFSPRPLTFLQEWLAIRRHGQDFAHTPMGFLAQGKPLQANHPFFGGDEEASAPVQNGDINGLPRQAGTISGGWREEKRARDGDEIEEGAVVFDGVDDMGANVGGEGEEEQGEEVVYDDSEYDSEYYTDVYSEEDLEEE
ncbi:uncharacterized protein B0T15DRAFT_415095 [Chaetomium strumarium]|uniref:ubiquitinyl hydrolase 1 n=1 Tax=Chaetomium strumarium TaxID=1170767 RepID=A0AAJ0M3K9_9PEZI|nr:hypothetical protein B0T15DRAFT_415095 [Chaetomium strumarium]